MKKSSLLLAAAILFFHVAANSQKTSAAAVGGVSLARLTGETGGLQNDYETNVGYTVGIMVETPITSRIAFFPGLHYVQKGTLQRPPEGTLITKSFIETRYAEFNANFIYKAPGTKGNFFAGLGPSIVMNLPSKKGTVTEGDKTETDVLWGNTIEKDLAGIDYGINLLAGYRIACGFFIMANYNLGMRDLRPVDESGPRDVQSRYVGIQLGWLLHNKPAK